MLAAPVAYSHYQRHQSEKATHPIASNASTTEDFTLPETLTIRNPSTNYTEEYSYFNDDSTIDLEQTLTADIKEPITITTCSKLPTDVDKDATLPDLQLSRASPISYPIAILPQYLTKQATTLTITEHSLPHLNSSFIVTDALDDPILTIHRDRPSLHKRQVITDPRTASHLLTIRRRGHPAGYTFTDPEDTHVAEVQGTFLPAVSGSKSTATFTNACDGTKVTLAVQGDWHNRHAVIRHVETDEVLARLSSELFHPKSLVGRRRTYQVKVSAGVDVVLVVALITALDARAN